MHSPRIAETKDVRFSPPVEFFDAGKPCVKIRGLIFHSAMAVENIDVHEEGELTRVMVSMTLARPDLSGAFEVFIPLSFSTSRITFGNHRATIWEPELVGCTGSDAS